MSPKKIFSLIRSSTCLASSVRSNVRHENRLFFFRIPKTRECQNNLIIFFCPKARVVESVPSCGKNRNFLATMKGYLKDIIATKDMNALFIVFILMVCRQTIGINVIVFYTVEIFNMAGAQMSPSTETIIVGVVQVSDIILY